MTLTAVAGILASVGRPIVSLATLPLLLAHLGQGGLGVWMIALSLIGLAGFVSAGLSASVVTEIGRASGRGCVQELQRLTAAATLIAAFWGLLVLLLASPAVFLVDWATALQPTGDLSRSDIARLVATLAGLLAIGLVTSVPRQVMIGRMHGYLAHFLDFAGVVLGVLCLLLAIWMEAPLWMLGLAFMAPPYLVSFGGGMIYLHRLGLSMIAARYFDRPTLSLLARHSFRMAGYQSAHAVSSQSDILLIGFILGAPDSAAYGVTQRVFSLPILIAVSVNHAQWPLLASADAKGDRMTVAKMFRLTLSVGSGTALCIAVFLALVYQPLLDLWLGYSLETEPTLLIGMVAWVLVATLVLTCDSVLRSRHDSTFLMWSMLVMAVLNVGATLFLLPRIGLSGAIWGSVLGYTLALLVPYLFRLRGLFAVGRVDP